MRLIDKLIGHWRRLRVGEPTPVRHRASPVGVLRKVTEYTELDGCMTLECGHSATKRPGATHPIRSRCVRCAAVDQEEVANA